VLLTLAPCVGLAACDWFAGPDPGSGTATGTEGGLDVTVPPHDATGGGGDAGQDGEAGTAADVATDAAEERTDGGGGGGDAGCSSCTYGCFDGGCTGPFTSLGGTTAVTTSGGSPVPLVMTPSNGSSTGGGPAPHTDSVTVTTTTSPGGTCNAVTLVFSLDPTFATSTPVTMQLATSTITTDTWTGIVPAQGAGTEAYFYVVATPNVGSKAYDPSGFGIHYAYAVN